MSRQSGLRLRIKRMLDVAVAGIALVMATPVMAVAALAIRRRMGAPVLFRQLRVGRGGRLFTLYKFRTMQIEGNGDDDSKRLTDLGRFLRSASLDELPQLVNVLRGDMSLVGPRPLPVKYLDRYTPTQNRRHEVLPGITGWTAVRGRNALAWEEKFERDVWYVDHWSLALDLRILAETVLTVVRRQGIAADRHATMPEFLGTTSATSHSVAALDDEIAEEKLAGRVGQDGGSDTL